MPTKVMPAAHFAALRRITDPSFGKKMSDDVQRIIADAKAGLPFTAADEAILDSYIDTLNAATEALNDASMELAVGADE